MIGDDFTDATDAIATFIERRAEAYRRHVVGQETRGEIAALLDALASDVRANLWKEEE